MQVRPEVDTLPRRAGINDDRYADAPDEDGYCGSSSVAAAAPHRYEPGRCFGYNRSGRDGAIRLIRRHPKHPHRHIQ